MHETKYKRIESDQIDAFITMQGIMPLLNLKKYKEAKYILELSIQKSHSRVGLNHKRLIRETQPELKEVLDCVNQCIANAEAKTEKRIMDRILTIFKWIYRKVVNFLCLVAQSNYSNTAETNNEALQLNNHFTDIKPNKTARSHTSFFTRSDNDFINDQPYCDRYQFR